MTNNYNPKAILSIRHLGEKHSPLTTIFVMHHACRVDISWVILDVNLLDNKINML